MYASHCLQHTTISDVLRPGPWRKRNRTARPSSYKITLAPACSIAWQERHRTYFSKTLTDAKTRSPLPLPARLLQAVQSGHRGAQIRRLRARQNAVLPSWTLHPHHLSGVAPLSGGDPFPAVLCGLAGLFQLHSNGLGSILLSPGSSSAASGASTAGCSSCFGGYI